jgi:hypothetical protein
MVNTALDEHEMKELEPLPLSNDTTCRRVYDIWRKRNNLPAYDKINTFHSSLIRVQMLPSAVLNCSVGFEAEEKVKKVSGFVVYFPKPCNCRWNI